MSRSYTITVEVITDLYRMFQRRLFKSNKEEASRTEERENRDHRPQANTRGSYTTPSANFERRPTARHQHLPR